MVILQTRLHFPSLLNNIWGPTTTNQKQIQVGKKVLGHITHDNMHMHVGVCNLLWIISKLWAFAINITIWNKIPRHFPDANSMTFGWHFSFSLFSRCGETNVQSWWVDACQELCYLHALVTTLLYKYSHMLYRSCIGTQRKYKKWEFIKILGLFHL